MLAGKQRGHEVRPSGFMPPLGNARTPWEDYVYISGRIYACVGSTKCLEHSLSILVVLCCSYLQLASIHVDSIIKSGYFPSLFRKRLTNDLHYQMETHLNARIIFLVREARVPKSLFISDPNYEAKLQVR